MNDKTAVIIGSGVAGLAVAIRLAAQGYRVSVYEKNSQPGGKLSDFEIEGYHFDAGPSLFTEPSNITELFEIAGEPVCDYINWKAVDISCKYFFENGKVVNAFSDPELFASEMQEQLGEDPATIQKYLAKSEKLYKNVGGIFLNNSLHQVKIWLRKKLFKAIATIKRAYLFNSLHSYNTGQFKTKEAVQLFNRFATYNGSDPYQAPSMLSLIAHLELHHGTFYPFGGMISISNALYKLAIAKGVQFYFDSPAQRIIHHEGKVKGIVVDNRNIAADIVVSNSDVYFTYKNLLLDHNRAKKLLKQERSSSAVLFYWGIKKEFSQLQLHNVFFSADYKIEFDHIFKKGKVSNDPTVYINVTSKMENSQAPVGKENWFILVNAPANNGQDWAHIKLQVRSAVISKLSRILGEDIEPFIETEQSSDPVLIEEQSTSFMGSLYGSASNSKMSAFLRHPNYSNTISGLYFCGGSVHPGGGIPLCLKSAKIVSELVKKDSKKHGDH